MLSRRLIELKITTGRAAREKPLRPTQNSTSPGARGPTPEL